MNLGIANMSNIMAQEGRVSLEEAKVPRLVVGGQTFLSSKLRLGNATGHCTLRSRAVQLLTCSAAMPVGLATAQDGKHIFNPFFGLSFDKM